ncbi:hypothetical protein [Amycolatopsis samaneae]|uniref:DUF8017 domain-containing protein n=1 Tax=Amycolatopsis samaneae TaxID=664691 RepID=A0ABW5G9N7_9PSEU
MGWFGRRREEAPGYEDNAALGGFGGYEPSDSRGFRPSEGYGAPQPSGIEQPEPPPRAEPRRIRATRPSRPPKRGRGYVGWIAVGVVALAGAAAQYFGSGHNDRSSAPASRGPSVYTPPPRATVPVSVAGWRSVAGRDGSYAYDVPPNWQPEPGTLHGWEKGPVLPGITLTTSAFLDSGFCQGQSASKRGGAGVTTVKVADPAGAAAQAVDNLAVSRYSPDAGPLAQVVRQPAQQAEVILAPGRTRPASIALAEVVPTDTGPCAPKRALVAAIAMGTEDPAKPQSAVLVAYADQDVPGAPDREQLLRVLRSYRGVPETDRATVTPPPSTR